MQRDECKNGKKPWNGKLIKRLLLTIIMADWKQFTLKDRLVIYTGAFVEFYNLRNCGEIFVIYGMIELEKIYALIV